MKLFNDTGAVEQFSKWGRDNCSGQKQSISTDQDWCNSASYCCTMQDRACLRRMYPWEMGAFFNVLLNEAIWTAKKIGRVMSLCLKKEEPWPLVANPILTTAPSIIHQWFQAFVVIYKTKPYWLLIACMKGTIREKHLTLHLVMHWSPTLIFIVGDKYMLYCLLCSTLDPHLCKLK